MPVVSNELKNLIAAAMQQKTELTTKIRTAATAQKAAEDAEIELRNRYLRLQTEARRGYPGNNYPANRLVLVNSKAYQIDLSGGVQGEIIRELELEQ